MISFRQADLLNSLKPPTSIWLAFKIYAKNDNGFFFVNAPKMEWNSEVSGGRDGSKNTKIAESRAAYILEDYFTKHGFDLKSGWNANSRYHKTGTASDGEEMMKKMQDMKNDGSVNVTQIGSERSPHGFITIDLSIFIPLKDINLKDVKPKK